MAKARTIAVAYASVGSGHRIAAEAIAAELTLAASPDTRSSWSTLLDSAPPRLSGNTLCVDLHGTRPPGSTTRCGAATWAGAVGRALGVPLLCAWLSGFSGELEELAPDVRRLHPRAAGHGRARACARRGASAQARQRRHRFRRARLLAERRHRSVLRRPTRARATSLLSARLPARSDRGDRRPRAPTVHPRVRLRCRSQALRSARRPPHRPRARGLDDAGPVRALQGGARGLVARARLAAWNVGRGGLRPRRALRRGDAYAVRRVSAPPTCRILGYVEHMAPLMACADLASAKPGGSVCAECLAAGVPLVLIGPAAGQENANAQGADRQGRRSLRADPRTIAEYARKAVAKPARLEKMHESALSHGPPLRSG